MGLPQERNLRNGDAGLGPAGLGISPQAIFGRLLWILNEGRVKPERAFCRHGHKAVTTLTPGSARGFTVAAGSSPYPFSERSLANPRHVFYLHFQACFVEAGRKRGPPF